MSTVHFNIGQKVEVNPFENVKYVIIPELKHNEGILHLHTFLNKKACEVSTRKIGGTWRILYDVSLLDFTTLLSWYAPYRGKFMMTHKSRNTEYVTHCDVHFAINEDIMSCW